MINFLYFYLIFNYLKISKKMTIKAKKFQFIVLLSIIQISFSNNKILKEEKKLTEEEITKKLNSIINNPESPLIAASLSVVKNSKTLYCNSTGTSRLNKDGSFNKSSTVNTKYRIASISKLFTAIGIWQLQEKGKLNLDEDVSNYLNFNLRNPYFNDSKITINMLLSHTSSIRDENYNIPFGHNISEYFTPGKELYFEGCFAKNKNEGPGYFRYSNMNYCLLGTIIENISGERFDKYMIKNVLNPLEITGSFNIYEMDIKDLNEVGTIYKKLKDNKTDPNGNFTSQCDDFTDGYEKKNFSDYIIGSNGALFGPMGSLRISIKELTNLLYMFINNGKYKDKEILKKETIDKMLNVIWSYDEKTKNGETSNELNRAFGGGPMIITNIGKNRIHEKKNFTVAGHTAGAYGLFGGLFFDRKNSYGLIYVGNGISRDTKEFVSNYSCFNNWALEFIKLSDEIAHFYEFESQNYLSVILLFLIAIVLIFIGCTFLFKKEKEEVLLSEQEI